MRPLRASARLTLSGGLRGIERGDADRGGPVPVPRGSGRLRPAPDAAPRRGYRRVGGQPGVRRRPDERLRGRGALLLVPLRRPARGRLRPRLLPLPVAGARAGARGARRDPRHARGPRRGRARRRPARRPPAARRAGLRDPRLLQAVHPDLPAERGRAPRPAAGPTGPAWRRRRGRAPGGPTRDRGVGARNPRGRRGRLRRERDARQPSRAAAGHSPRDARRCGPRRGAGPGLPPTRGHRRSPRPRARPRRPPPGRRTRSTGRSAPRSSSRRSTTRRSSRPTSRRRPSASTTRPPRC